jgi:hypothetical protein
LKTEGERARRENRVDPRLLYVTPRQAELWREVARAHSPVQANPDFARCYREAFAAEAAGDLPQAIHLVALGGGTGGKEAALGRVLSAAGRNVVFSAIDISADLAREAMAAVAEAGAQPGEIIVADLEHFARWSDLAPNLPRLYTCFGVAPNLRPAALIALLRAALRPGDRLLASVHLAPVRPGVDCAAALREILPQYDNTETRAWLRQALVELDLDQETASPQIAPGELEGVPAILARAAWKAGTTPPLDLFFSLRYTPELWERLLADHGFRSNRLALTACRQEGIWEIGA